MAKVLENNVNTLTPTGNPQYQAYEIIEGGEYDNKVDIFSTGVVFYEMV